MDRRGLIILASIVAVAIGLIAFAGGGPNAAEEQLRRDATQAVSEFESSSKAFASNAGEIESALEKHDAFFSDTYWTETAPTRIAESRKALAAQEDSLAQLRTWQESAEEDDAAGLRKAIISANAARSQADWVGAKLLKDVRSRVAIIEQQPKLLAEVKEHQQALEKISFEAERERVTRAIEDWPSKDADLRKRLSTLENRRQAGLDAATKAIPALEGTLDPNGFEELAGWTKSARDHAAEVAGATGVGGSLSAKIDELYTSFDRILVDMAIIEGATVSFTHTLKTVRTRIPDFPGPNAKEAPADAEVTTTEHVKTVPVSKSHYEKHKGNLGMVLQHKPGGLYDHEIDDIVQPPGYGYVAKQDSSGKGRNNYGYWNSHSGGSFWVWYGQYSLMSNMLGMGGSRIYDRDYGSWRRSYDRGNSWYGTRASTGRPTFGSKGSFTQSRYSNSKYVRSGGFKSSRYVQSGGKFRGTRYETNRSSGSRARSFGGSSRRSGSRFGGGK